MPSHFGRRSGMGVPHYLGVQDHVAQLVAEQWEKQNGRGISVNKQNLYRYLKNEGGSEKYQLCHPAFGGDR